MVLSSAVSLEERPITVSEAKVAVPSQIRHQKLRHLTFVLVSTWLLYQGAWGTRPDYESGDGVEYLLMTEALWRHASPNLVSGDTQNASAEKRLSGLPGKSREVLPGLLGFISTSDGYWYCWHFFFYPMLNLPMRLFAEYVGLQPLRAFTLTNALLMICVVGQLLYGTRYPFGLQLSGVTLFLWSSVQWYFSWLHPEVMTCAFVFMSVVSWFHDRRYWAIWLASLAAMQNPPLFMLSLFYMLPTLFRPVPNVLFNVLMCGLTSFWVILPPLFYRLHYGVGSLIIDLGYLDRNQVTLRRLFGFFFDLDQGMILSLPVALPLLMYLYYRQFISGARTYNMLLIPLVIGMTYFIMPMNNWNHGQAGINRYATWCSMIPLAYLIQLLDMGWTRRRFALVMLCVALPQALVIEHYGGTQVPSTAYRQHKELAVLMLEHFPRLYNPDPQIFIARTLPYKPVGEQVKHFGTESESPLIAAFIGQDNKIRKLCFRRGNEQKLLDYGWKSEDIPRVLAGVRFENDWAYLHPGDFQTSH